MDSIRAAAVATAFSSAKPSAAPAFVARGAIERLLRVELDAAVRRGWLT